MSRTVAAFAATGSDLVIVTEETHPVPTEEALLLAALEAAEIHPVPVEDISGTQVTFTLEDLSSLPLDETSADVIVAETYPVPLDQTALDVVVSETHPVPVEEVSFGTDVRAEETHAIPTDESVIGAVVTETHINPLESGGVSIDVSFLWPDVVVTNLNNAFESTAAAIDKDPNSVGACTATSSGLAGTGGDQNIKNCDLILSCPDMNLGDLTITEVTLSWYILAGSSGMPSNSGHAEVNWQFSLDDGATWTTFFAQTAAVSSSTLSRKLDIGSVVSIQSEAGATEPVANTTASVPRPPGTVNGDLILVYVLGDTTTPLAAPDSSWVKIATDPNGAAWYHIAASDPAFYTFTNVVLDEITNEYASGFHVWRASDVACHTRSLVNCASRSMASSAPLTMFSTMVFAGSCSDSIPAICPAG